MKNKYILKTKQIIVDFFKDEQVKIVLFGSRARKDNHISSDVDVGIIPYRKIDADEIQRKIAILKEKLEESNIPYKVELVNLSEVSEDFKNEILREAVIWKDYN